MKNFLGKYYFGLWQNMYQINWPIRFLIEWGVLITCIGILIKIIHYVGRKCSLKTLLVKAWYWFVTEVVHVVCRNSDWEVAFDHKMIDWGNEVIDGNGNRKSKSMTILKMVIYIGIVIVYFFAVCVDLPVSKRFSGYYLDELENVKAFFQKYEVMLSKDYEQYPPLFVKIEKEEDVATEEALPVPEEKGPVYIQLNEEGKNGSNIRSEANVNSRKNIIGGVNGESEILYKDEWTYDGKRYWIRVYIPDTGLEGWLSGKLIDSEQLEELINENER